MKTPTFSDVTSCWLLCSYWYCGGVQYLQLQGQWTTWHLRWRHNGCETSMTIYQLTQHNMPLGLNVHQNSCENFESHKTCQVCVFRYQLIVSSTLRELISTIVGFIVESTPSTELMWFIQAKCTDETTLVTPENELVTHVYSAFQFWYFGGVLQFVAAWCIVNLRVHIS